MPIEKMDVSGAGDIIASIGHDNRVKSGLISYLEKMEYERKRKPHWFKRTSAEEESW